MERFCDSQTWIVIFDKTYGCREWWHWFMKPEFRHVHAVRDCEGRALMVNSFSHVLGVKLYDMTLESYVEQELALTPTAILSYTVHYGAHYKNAPIEFLHCVSVVKRLLGLRGWFITPEGLYKEMLRAGALVIKPALRGY
jgi:hypothetical protein